MLKKQGLGYFSSGGAVFHLADNRFLNVETQLAPLGMIPERKIPDQEKWARSVDLPPQSPIASSAGACEICGFSRLIEKCHIIPSRFGGPASPHNLLDLCPNHHTLFDRNMLTPEEVREIWPKVYSVIGKLGANEQPALLSWRDAMYARYGFAAVAS